MTTTNVENKKKGVFIPENVLSDKNLNITEKLIYSVYHFYTFNGDGSCHLTNETLASTLGITLKTFKKTKKKLKDKGYIRTNGGIKVEATGVKMTPITESGVKMTPITESGVKMTPITEVIEGGKNETLNRGKNETLNRGKNEPHNNKENNKEKNGVYNRVLVIQNEELDSSSDSISSGVLVPDNTDTSSVSSTDEGKESKSLQEAFHHFFSEGFEGGIYTRVIKDVASSDNHRKTLWERWDAYCKWLKDENTDTSFRKTEESLNAFLHLIGRVYTEPDEVKTKRVKLHQTYTSLMKVFYLRQWRRFISNLNMYEAQDCKRTRLAFFDKVASFYQDVEEREKVQSKMETEYAEAYKATRRNSDLKYEDLDPDVKYSNLHEEGTPLFSEEEDSLLFNTPLQPVEKEKETVSDTFNRVYAGWVKLKREHNQRGKAIQPEYAEGFIKKAGEMGMSDHEMDVLHNLIREDVCPDLKQTDVEQEKGTLSSASATDWMLD